MKASDEIDKLTRQLNDGSLPPDEPLFTLRAQDPLASTQVMLWAEAALRLGVNEEKVAEARELANMMNLWPHSRLPD